MAEIGKEIVTIKVKDKEYSCSIAIDDWERERGLMHKDTLEENEGMLFVYKDIQDTLRFWMKDTPLHLDIIFIGPDSKVISNQEGKPNDTTIIEENNVLFVLEVPYSSGIVSGNEVDFDNLEEVLEERIDSLEDMEDETSESYLEDKVEEIEDIIEILSSNGKVQGTLKGGERIFSRKNTKVLIRQAKKAEKLKTDSAYKRLGKSVFKYMKGQDEREPEYVESK